MAFSLIRVSDIDGTAPQFPRVVKRRRRPFLQIEDGREYEIAADPIKTLGLLHHLAGKIWADRRFFFYAIARIAQAQGWAIHPNFIDRRSVER
jgi:hypothetical protein